MATGGLTRRSTSRSSIRAPNRAPPSAKDKVPEKAPKVIAAIDFGTTCTGYAYYIQKQGRPRLDLEGINTQQSWSGSAELGLQAPTSLLMTPQEEFHSFGFQAESKYELLAYNNEHLSWYFFRYFKMTLHHMKDISMWMQLDDITGKKMNACDVFAHAIKYVKEHLYGKIEDALGKGNVTDGDVQWVLTVPAIWRDSAKQFMRKAAEKVIGEQSKLLSRGIGGKTSELLLEAVAEGNSSKCLPPIPRAGIPGDQLTLALEPESAAIFCKEAAVNRALGTEGVVLKAFDPGEKFLVLDLGGGTVDTTVHEVQKDGRLKELHAATGGPWGGELVNTAFEDLIKSLVTDDVFHAYKKQKASDWLDVQKSFEIKKREFTDRTEDTNIHNFTLGLEEVYKQITKRDLEIRDGKIAGKYKARIARRALLLPPETMRKLFQEAIKKIVDHIEALLRKSQLKGVSSILLVGGFSESPIVKECIKARFSKLRVISPPKASSAILKGAVLFGLNQAVIAVRLSPFTYGVRTRKLFDRDIHPTERMVETNGEKRVKNVFCKHIEIGQAMYINDVSHVQTYTMKQLRLRNISMSVFRSEDPNPAFCDEPGCREIGKLHFDIPATVPFHNVKFRLSMTCQGTELVAKATIDGCKGEFKAKFDFLNNSDQYQSEEDTMDVM